MPEDLQKELLLKTTHTTKERRMSCFLETKYKDMRMCNSIVCTSVSLSPASTCDSNKKNFIPLPNSSIIYLMGVKSITVVFMQFSVFKLFNFFALKVFQSALSADQFLETISCLCLCLFFQIMCAIFFSFWDKKDACTIELSTLE